MKIVHILGSIERSGAETMLRDSAQLFRQQGATMSALSTGVTRGEMSAAFDSAGIEVQHLPFSRSPRFFFNLWMFLLRSDDDVLNIHTERASFWIGLIARLAGKRVVIRTVHSVFTFQGRLRTVRALQRWLCRHILQVRYIFVGASVEANERDRFGVIGSLVPNSVDTGRFRPLDDCAIQATLRKRFSIPVDSMVLISVGRCIESKQHDHVLECVAKLMKHGLSVYYVHVGDGPLSQAEHQRVEELGIRENVLFLGERDDISELLQASDVFLMPSRYEGLGVAVLEAAACGLPVIAYDVPGLRDAVVHGETGFLVQPDVDSLTEAVEALCSDVMLRNELGHRAVCFVRTYHSLDTWVSLTLSVYNRALGLADQ